MLGPIALAVFSFLGLLFQEPGEKAHIDLTESQLERMWMAFDRVDDEGCRLAYSHIRAMILSPRTSSGFLRKKIKPVLAPDARQVNSWLRSLDSDDFDKREAATAALEKAAPLVVGTLRMHRASGKLSLEAGRRIARVLEKHEKELIDPDELRARRAIEVLFGIGTPEARELLRELAKGAPESGVTQQARRSLAALENVSR